MAADYRERAAGVADVVLAHLLELWGLRRCGDAATARWATATPNALVAWDGDQLRLDGVEATLEAAEALVEGRAVAHVVCLNPRGPRRPAAALGLGRGGGRLLAREPLVRDARDAALAHGPRERDLERRPDPKPMNEFVELLEAGRRDDLDELRGFQYK